MLESFQGILHGLIIAGQPVNLLHTALGVFIGTMISHLPGIGPSAGIALLIPVTFGMNPGTALMMLAGIYYGCMYGGAVTAILINTPGDGASVMTVLDGYPMARKGRAGAALAIAAMSSFISGTLGVTALTFIAMPLSRLALKFGPAEYFALLTFALTMMGALTGSSIAKGMISTFLGLLLATIGIDLQSGEPRFTLGIPELQEGISFLVVVVGLFAIAEVSRMVEGTLEGTMHIVKVQGKLWFTKEEWSRAWKAILRGWCVGFFCGAAPGLGGTISGMLGYFTEKRFSKHPEEFGKGAPEGVAAPEAAVNADACGAFVHLLALGIPGSGATAVMLGAFIMYGIQPGPMLFQTHGPLVWGLIASMYIGNVMLLVLNLPLVGVFARILYAPPQILLVLILAIASVGIYSFGATTLDLYLGLLFGALGYLFYRLDIPKAPLIFGLILGGKLEQSFRQALTISGGDPTTLIHSPLSVGLLMLAALSITLSLWAKRKATKEQKQELNMSEG